MAAWTLIPCLVELRSEFNELSPNRDKGADGSIGDSNHTSSSDHTPDEDSDVLRDHDADDKNEVHALDIDSSGTWPGEGTQKQRFHKIVMRIIAGERAKWLSASDKCRLNYVIWDGKIYDKDVDFEPRDYNGSDPHTNHAHFSGRYETSCENDTRPWGVLTEDDMALSADDLNKIRAIVKDEVAKTFTATRFAWSADNPADANSYRRTPEDLLGDVWAAVMRGTTKGGQALPPAGAFGQVLDAVTSDTEQAGAPTVDTVTEALKRTLRDGVAG